MSKLLSPYSLIMSFLGLGHLCQSVRQLANEKLAGKVGQLSEENLSRWSQMDVPEQLDLYRVMLELEIDAQRRILAQSGDDLDALNKSKEALAKLELRLEQVDAARQDPSARPDWLDPDRPATLSFPRQRQAETKQRFDIMLQEIRFLIRQQRRELATDPAVHPNKIPVGYQSDPLQEKIESACLPNIL